MIEEAQKRNSGNQIEYRISGLEEYDYPENEWDCVISNLALHYIEDIVEIFQKVYRTLKPGGNFSFFNIEHPDFYRRSLGRIGFIQMMGNRNIGRLIITL